MNPLRSVARRLAELELWAVSALALVSLLDPRWLLPCVLMAGCFWLLRWVGDGRLTVRTGGDLGVLLLMAALPLNLWLTGFQAISLQQAYRLLSGVALYYALVNWANSPARLRLATLGLMVVGVGVAAYSLVQSEAQARSLLAMLRSLRQFSLPLPQDVVNPNVMAGSLALIFPLALSGAFSAWGKSSSIFQLFSGATTVFIGGAIALSLSRGAWVALVLSVLVLIFLRWRGRWLVFAVALTAAGIIAYRVAPLLMLDVLLAGTSAGDLVGRLNIWSRAIIMMRDFPFTGVGLGMFQTAISRLFPLTFSGSAPANHAHNLYLQIGVDLGIPALIAWLALLLLAFWVSAQTFAQTRRHRSRTDWFAGASAGLFCGVVALAVHGVFDAVTWGMVRPAPLVWVLWGLIMAYGNLAWRHSDR